MQKFAEEDVQAALEIAHSEYFAQIVALLSLSEKATSHGGELSYVKVPVTTPQGGNYLVSILHIDGPKLDLLKVKELAEKIELKK